MKNALYIAVALLTTMQLSAQEPDDMDFTHRDSVIQVHLKSERYAKALGLLNTHLIHLENSNQSDSIYRYAYGVGRAEWKVHGVNNAVKRVEEIVNQIEASDADTNHILKAINDLSWIYYETGRHEKCFEADERFLNICNAFSGATVAMRSKAIYNLGFDYLSQGDGKTAVGYFKQALEPLAQDDFNEISRTVDTYNALGAALFRTGDFDGAKAAFQQSLFHIPRLDDQGKIYGDLANCHNNLALIAHTEGDIISAKDHYEEMVKLRKKSHDLATELWERDRQNRLLMTGYRNLGSVYISMGDYSRAKRLFEYIGKIKSDLLEPDDPEFWRDEEVFGTINMLTGELDSAQSNFTNYANHCRSYYGVHSYYTASSYLHLGELAVKRKDFSRAKMVLDSAIAITVAISSEDNSQDLPELYLLRAEAFRGERRYANSEGDLQLAAHLIHRTRPATDPILSRIYTEQAKLAQLTRNLDSAQVYADRAISVLTGGASGKKQVSESTIYSMYLPGAYHERALIELATHGGNAGQTRALGYLRKAIQALEHSRKGIMSEEDRNTLYDSHRNVFDLAADVCYDLYSAGSNTAYVDTMLHLSEESKSLMVRYRLNRISTTRFTGIPDSLVAREQSLIRSLSDTRDAESTALDIDSLEKEYKALTKRISEQYPEYYRLMHYTPTVGIADIKRELVNPENSVIEYILSGQNVYALVINRDTTTMLRFHAPELEERLAKYNASIVSNNPAKFQPLGEKLYTTLFLPLEGLLRGSQVSIIPDGPLFLLNFEALQTNQGRYLIEDYTFSYLLSATTAIEFRRSYTPTGHHRVLAVAPGFSDDMKASYLSRGKDSAFFDTDYMELIRQPFAVETAQAAADLFSGKALLETSATETNLRNEAGIFDILFFGTHAELNVQSPMLSRLVLSKSENDQPDDDGYLYAYEIYDLPIRAGLAILTACATGTGKSSPSEGIYSLAHGFAYAGCPSVVMSLWQIDEKTSSQIIENFMRRIESGQRKDEALRQAKLDFLRTADPELISPYFWAGMVLLGDGGPLGSQPQNIWWLVAIIGGAVVLIVFFIARRKSRV